MNPDFKVVGFARKMINAKSIHGEIIDNYNRIHNQKIRVNTVKHVANILKNQFSTENKRKASERKNYVNGKKVDKATALRVLDELQKIVEKYRGGLVEKLNEMIGNGELESKLMDLLYIKVINGEIQWVYNYNFSLTLKNNKWKMKHYTLLSSYIFDYLYIDAIIQYHDSDANKLIRFINKGIEKIIKLINIIKSMSEQNIGGLFVVLKAKDVNIYEDGEEVAACVKKCVIPEGLIIAKEDVLNYKKVLSLQDKEDSCMSILDIDSYLVELIAGVDGATLLDNDLNVISFGEIINNSSNAGNRLYGARTNAAINASYHGLSIKISEDGDIEVYIKGSLKYKI